MNLVRHVQHVAGGALTFRRITVGQRWFRRAARNKGELPGDISRVHKRSVDSLPAKRTRQMGGVAQQETPPIAQALNCTFVHLEIGNPSELAQPHVDAGSGVEQRTQLGCCRKLAPSISFVAIDKDKPAVIREWRKQYEPSRPHNDAAAFGLGGKTNFRVGDHISTAIGFSIEMLVHRMTRYAVTTACAQHVSCRDRLRSAAGIECYT